MKSIFKLIITAWFLTGLLQPALSSEMGSEQAGTKAMTSNSSDNKIMDAAQEYLREKAKFTGTVDIYDSNIKSVRNLQLMKYHEKAQKNAEGYKAHADYRDIKSGAVVTLEISLEEKNGEYEAVDINIKDIKELDSGEDQADKEYSDEEIQKVMKEYIASQAKFTGHVMLFDEDKNNMRKLNLVNIKPEVRRLGVLYISTAEFKDEESGELVNIDVTVENKKGRIGVERLRIRGVKNP